MRMRTILVTLVALLGLGLAGCGGGGSGSTLDVVASTNVYGDIAAQIGGSHVHVTSVLSDPNADPHLFEPGTENGLAVAQARVVIQNGAGYDDFMHKLEAASPSPNRVVVTIADVLGVHGRDANPHLWYDVPRLPRIAGAIAAALEQADAMLYNSQAVSPITTQVRAAAQHAGIPVVAVTETLPPHLSFQQWQLGQVRSLERALAR